jgi:hypothetical protein
MNILDLAAMSIEIQMFSDSKGDIVLRFCKGNRYLEHMVKLEEILQLDQGGTGSLLLEALVCREVVNFFENTQTKGPNLKIGDWVICAKRGIVGQIVKMYIRNEDEQQIIVRTRSGRNYHEHANNWKPYQFGTTTNRICMDELAFMNGDPRLGRAAELLSPNGQYAARFAQNHGISIDDAMNHPTVKAHQEYFNSVKIDQEILKAVYPSKNVLKK